MRCKTCGDKTIVSKGIVIPDKLILMRNEGLEEEEILIGNHCPCCIHLITGLKRGNMDGNDIKSAVAGLLKRRTIFRQSQTYKMERHIGLRPKRKE